MLLRDALKKLKYDRRLQEYNLDKGLLSKQELSSHIDGLPDSESASEALRFREERRSSEDRLESKSSQPQQGFGAGSSQGDNTFGLGSNNGSYGRVQSDDDDNY